MCDFGRYTCRTAWLGADIINASSCPLRLIGNDAPAATRHLAEIDLGDGQNCVAQDADIDLAPFDVPLHEHFLPQLEHRAYPLGELTCIPHDGALFHPQRRIFGCGLDDRRKADAQQRVAATNQTESGDRQPSPLKHAVDNVFPQTDGGGVAGCARERDLEQLENRNDCGLEGRNAVDSLAHVERKVKFPAAELLDPLAVLIDRDVPHVVSFGRQRPLDRCDGAKDKLIRGGCVR